MYSAKEKLIIYTKQKSLGANILCEQGLEGGEEQVGGVGGARE